MLVVEVPPDLMPSNVQTSKIVSLQGEVLAGSESYSSVTYVEMENETGKDVNLVRIDISFKSPSHTGLQTTQLVCIFWNFFSSYLILYYTFGALGCWILNFLTTTYMNWMFWENINCFLMDECECIYHYIFICLPHELLPWNFLAVCLFWFLEP